MSFDTNNTYTEWNYENVVTNLSIDFDAGYASWNHTDVFARDWEYQILNYDNREVLTRQ